MDKNCHLGFRVSQDLHDKLQYVAEYEGRSMSGQIIYLAQKCVRDFEKEHGPITPEDIAEQKK